jgi:ankyrin repeat protein
MVHQRHCTACTGIWGAPKKQAYQPPRKLFPPCQVADLLLKCGANVDAANASGCTSLYFAALLADIKAMELLLAHGANPSAASSDGTTPLHLAARLGDAQVARVLLAAKADVNAVDHDGATPLFFAAQQGSSQVAQLLLEAGADPGLCPAVGTGGWTPLHAAAAAGHLAVVRVLQACSALELPGSGGPPNPTKPDGDGATPWQVAVESGHAEVAAELEDWERRLAPAGREDGSLGTPPRPSPPPGPDGMAAGEVIAPAAARRTWKQAQMGGMLVSMGL